MKLLKTLGRFLKNLSIGLGIFFHFLALHTVGKNLTPGAFALHLRKKIKRVGITVQHQRNQIEFSIGVFAVVTLLPTSVLTHDSLRQRGRVVSASDSQSGGPGFESRSGHLLDLCSVVPSSNSRPRL